MRELTLIVARRAVTEPKTVMAGFTLKFCSEMLRAPMDAVSEERAASRPSDCEEFVAIVENRGNCEEIVRHKGCEENLNTSKGERPLCLARRGPRNTAI